MGYAHGTSPWHEPVEEGFLSIGWNLLGDLSQLANNRGAFKKALAAAYPNEKPGAIPVKAGVLYRFAEEMAVGDYVVYPSKPDRMVNLGTVESGYIYDPVSDPAFPHRRNVIWLHHLARTAFSQSALYEIGSAITLFQISTYAEEFLAVFEGRPIVSESVDDVDDVTAGAVSAQVEESTEDFILKRLNRHSPDESVSEAEFVPIWLFRQG